MTSILQDWVMTLPLREQGTLLAAVRGCDDAPKFPIESPERRLVASLRGAFLNPADARELKRPGAFMTTRLPEGIKPSALMHYPAHWVLHAMHAVEVLGYRHPDPDVRDHYRALYHDFCRSLHVFPEMRDDMVARLSEDRIALDTVVSE